MKTYYQLLTEGQYSMLVCQQWFTDRESAEAELQNCERFWPDQNFWIEEGTEWIREKCKCCGTPEANEIYDAYGITTGYWCDDCYNSSKYPYRKDRYDYAGAGERLDDDY